jgi:hypothetical protein
MYSFAATEQANKCNADMYLMCVSRGITPLSRLSSSEE